MQKYPDTQGSLFMYVCVIVCLKKKRNKAVCLEATVLREAGLIVHPEMGILSH